MSGTQVKTRRPSDADLRNDPEIGRSKGARRGDPRRDGATTSEGGVDPRQRGRETK